MLRRVPIFENVGKDFIHEVMYSLKEKFYLEGEYIANMNEDTDKIIFIEKGVVEAILVCEGNEFIVGRYGPGTIMHHDLFLTEDKVYVDLRVHTAAKIQLLHR